MAITATFAADFSSFTAAIDKADVKLRSFETGAAKVNTTLSKFGNQFSGTKLIQDALAMEKAIGAVGGTTALTTKELIRAGEMAAQAADKMKRLGMEVPPGLQAIATAGGAAKTELQGIQQLDAFGKMQGQIGGAAKELFSFQGLIKTIGPQIVAAFSVGAVVGFAKEIGAFAGQMADLSAETGVSTDRLQQLNYVAAGAGLEVQDITKSVSQLSNRLASGDESAAGAVETLGLSLDDLLDDSPDQAFIKISDAVAGIADPMQRTALAMDLFGKAGPQMLRMMEGDLEALLNEAQRSGAVLDENLIKKADAFDDAWTQALLVAKGETINFIGAAISAWEELEGVIRRVANATIPKPAQQAASDAAGMLLNPFKAMRESFGAFQNARYFEQEAPYFEQAAIKGAQSRAPVVPGALPSQAGAKAGQRTGLSNQAKAALKKDHESFAAAYEQATKKQQAADEKAAAATAKKTAALKKQNDEIQDFIELEYRQGAAAAAAGKQFSWMQSMPKGVDLLPTPTAVGDVNTSLFAKGLTDLPDTLRRENVFGPVAPKMGKDFSTKFGDAVGANFGPSIMKAIQGGGNVTKSIASSLGADLTGSLFGKDSGIMKSLTGKEGVLGKALGSVASMLPGIGALAGPAIDLAMKGISKLFGGAAKETNKARDAALDQFGGGDQFRKLAVEAGVTDAALRKVFDTKKVKDFEAAFADVAGKIKTFNSEQEADAARLTAAYEKYGFTFEQIGAKAQQSQLDTQAKELIEDWRVLVGSGIEVGLVTDKMSASINEYLQTAIKVGAEIPAAMRPILERMVDQGTLTDEAGNKITDLEAAGVTFAESMTQGFDRVVEKLDEMIAKVLGVGSAMASIPKNLDVVTNYRETRDSGGGGNDLPGYAGGTGGKFLDFKGGTPVMLHGKEAVVTQAEASGGAGLAGMAASINNLQATMLRAIRENALAVRDQTLLAMGRT